MVRARIDRDVCADTHRTHYGSGLPVFRGDLRQDGYGLGALLMRFAGPILKPLIQTVGRNVVSSGGKVLSNVVKNSIPLVTENLTQRLFGSRDTTPASTPSTPPIPQMDNDYTPTKKKARKRRVVSSKRGVAHSSRRRRDILDY